MIGTVTPNIHNTHPSTPKRKHQRRASTPTPSFDPYHATNPHSMHPRAVDGPKFLPKPSPKPQTANTNVAHPPPGRHSTPTATPTPQNMHRRVVGAHQNHSKPTPIPSAAKTTTAPNRQHQIAEVSRRRSSHCIKTHHVPQRKAPKRVHMGSKRQILIRVAHSRPFSGAV